MNTTRYYAGFGSRTTPADTLQTMQNFGRILAQVGFILRSGHSSGADQAFETGAKEVPNALMEIWVPWLGFNNAPKGEPYKIALGHPQEKNFATVAQRHHGNWGVCNPAAKQLLTRNVPIIMGEDLASPVEFGICYSTGPGGTDHTIKIANRYDIPIFNLGKAGDLEKLMKFGETLG